MLRFDTAIHGRGLLPGLLALHLLDRQPGLAVLLLCGDDTICGEQLEPVVVDRLGDAARLLVEPFCVARWPGYFIARDGKIDRHESEVWLLDPLQVWLELEGRAATCQAVARCGEVKQADGKVHWAGGETQVSQLIDLSALTASPSESEIIGIEAGRQLGLPILADYDTASDGWEANQLLPLGDERVVVRKLPRRQGLLAAHSGFESLLNALVGETLN